LTDTLFLKNVIFKEFNRKVKLIEGMDKINRIGDNGENYSSLTGTKPQINRYLQDCGNNILSDRLRTLNNLPKFRIINTTRERIQ
jgi:hypothetical protein